MKKLLIVIIAIIAFFSMSCKAFERYEDTNGDNNYTLQHITEEMLIKNDSGLQVGAVSTKTTKNGETNISLSVMTFDGVNEIHRFKKGSYVVTINFKVSSGNTRLVITDGSKVIKGFNVNEDNQEYEFTCDKPYYLKLAGESCEFELKVVVKSK